MCAGEEELKVGRVPAVLRRYERVEKVGGRERSVKDTEETGGSKGCCEHADVHYATC